MSGTSTSTATRRAQALLDAGLCGLLGLIVFFIGFGRSPLDLRLPLGFGDLTYYYGVMNAPGLRGEVAPHLGYPFGLDTAYFPDSAWIQILGARAITWLTSTVFFGVNAVYVLSFAVAAIAAWLACRLASVPRVLSILIAVAYTAIPTHWFRIDHAWLATMYSLPVALAIALIVLTGRLDQGQSSGILSRREWTLACMLLCVVLALSGLYYTFYGLLLIALAVVFRFSKAPGHRAWLLNLIPLVVVGIGTLLAMAPGIGVRLTTDVEAGYQRPIYDAVLYAGQFVDAILPTTVSMMPVFSRLANPMIAINEWASQANSFGVRWTADQGTTLILIAAVALLLWLAAWGGGRRVAHDARLAPADRRGARQARMTLVFLAVSAALTALWFVPFGLGTYFSMAVTLNFRGWDRMIALFQLLLLVSLGLIIHLALLRVGQARRRMVLIAVVALASVTVLLDTVLPARAFYSEQIAGAAERVHPASMVVEQVDQVVPAGCAILQLPYRLFPEAAPIQRLGVYEPLWFGLVDRNHPWSYGGVFGSTQDQWLQRVSADPVANLGELKALGFCAILVDVRGYDQAGIDAVVPQLTRSLGPPVLAQGVEQALIYAIP